MKIKLNSSRQMLEGGFVGISVGLSVAGATTIAGGVAAGLAATAGALSLGVTAANLAGAFTPGQSSSSPSQAQITAQENTLTTQLAQDNTAIATVQSSTGTARVVDFISIGLAVVALGAGVFLIRRKK